jgi:hypothetical protein
MNNLQSAIIDYLKTESRQLDIAYRQIMQCAPGDEALEQIKKRTKLLNSYIKQGEKIDPKQAMVELYPKSWKRHIKAFTHMMPG